MIQPSAASVVPSSAPLLPFLQIAQDPARLAWVMCTDGGARPTVVAPRLAVGDRTVGAVESGEGFEGIAVSRVAGNVEHAAVAPLEEFDGAAESFADVATTTSHADDDTVRTAASTTAASLNALLATKGACGCWVGIMRFCFPVYADPAVEEEYQHHDGAAANPATHLLCVAAAVALAVLCALVAIQPYGPAKTPAVVVAVILVAICAALALPVALRTVARTVMGVVVVVAVHGYGLFLWWRGYRFAMWSVQVVGSMCAFVMLLVLPDVPHVRVGLMLLVFAGVCWPTYMATAAPGRSQYAEHAIVGALLGLADIVVFARRHRSQFADARRLELLRELLATARTRMDRSLAGRLPPCCTALLRQEPTLPLTRPLVVHATVVAIDVHLAAPAAPLATPPAASLAGSEGAAAAVVSTDALCVALRALARAAPEAFVSIDGNMVVMVILDAPDAGAATPAAYGAGGTVTGKDMQHTLLRAFGHQPLPAAHQPVYPVAAFPADTDATVRCGMHRAPLVAGLLGTRQCAFSYMGPALDGARKLARQSIALGALVVSADADWRGVPLAEVPGVGAVSIVPLGSRSNPQQRRRTPLVRGGSQGTEGSDGVPSTPS